MFRCAHTVMLLVSALIGTAAIGSANAGDMFKGQVFKGSATGDAFFSDAGPLGGFRTDNAVGNFTHLGKSLATLYMVPELVPNADGTVSSVLNGRALLKAANGDLLCMYLVADSHSSSEDSTGTIRTDVFKGTYQMTGGTGRFAGASLSSALTITIRCQLSPRPRWEIDIRF
ncbi:MAG: hypothetical protein KDB03_28040 [Planctomycetales bacterium]|nr:hypothetical protein [Planctomycetales bacterium]